MNNLVIVAIPSKDDYVWKISSEKVPHMTLLFLGEVTEETKIGLISEFLAHAVNTTLKKFGMEVEHRGDLGIDQADVLFFDTKYSTDIVNFRSQLLKNDNIKMAYDSVEQFPEWLPHLTLGYPESPAKEDERDYPGINYVEFDKVALWFEDYEGFEFPLKPYDWDMAVAMGSRTERGETAVNEILHFGVKGMKWGIRRNRDNSGPVKTTISKTRTGKVEISTVGGGKSTASVDAVRAAQASQKLRTSGINSLSNQELMALAKRADLENKIRANANTPMNQIKKQTQTITTGTNAVKAVLGGAAAISSVIAFHNSPTGKGIETIIIKGLKAAKR